MSEELTLRWWSYRKILVGLVVAFITFSVVYNVTQAIVGNRRGVTSVASAPVKTVPHTTTPAEVLFEYEKLYLENLRQLGFTESNERLLDVGYLSCDWIRDGSYSGAYLRLGSWYGNEAAILIMKNATRFICPNYFTGYQEWIEG